VIDGAGYSVASIVTAVAASFGTAAIGGLVTDIGPWYRALRKPSWQPPDWLFGPVWTLIFSLIAAAMVLSWNAAAGSPGSRSVLVAAFAVNLVLNVLWSFLFFGRKRPDLALVEVVALWLSITVLIAVVRPFSALGAWLLGPYLLWVSFAAVLNRAIVRLNGPFPHA
jgi:tryptophan-rich sensory protein